MRHAEPLVLEQRLQQNRDAGAMLVRIGVTEQGGVGRLSKKLELTLGERRSGGCNERDVAPVGVGTTGVHGTLLTADRACGPPHDATPVGRHLPDAAQPRSSRRRANRRPDHVSSMAATLMSTQSGGQHDLAQHVLADVRRDTRGAAWATRSRACRPAAGFGAPRAVAARARAGSRRTATRHRACLQAGGRSPARRGARRGARSSCSGPPSTATRHPGANPSLRTSGVPE